MVNMGVGHVFFTNKLSPYEKVFVEYLDALRLFNSLWIFVLKLNVNFIVRQNNSKYIEHIVGVTRQVKHLIGVYDASCSIYLTFFQRSYAPFFYVYQDIISKSFKLRLFEKLIHYEKFCSFFNYYN